MFYGVFALQVWAEWNEKQRVALPSPVSGITQSSGKPALSPPAALTAGEEKYIIIKM